MSEENKVETVVEELEEKALDQIETYHEEGNEENEKVIDDAKNKIKEIYESLKEKIKGLTDKEEIKQGFEKANNMAQDVLNKTREKAIELSQNEKFIQTVLTGKEFLNAATDVISDAFKTGYDAAMNNETFKAVIDTAEEKLNTIKEDERVISVLNKTEEVANQVSAKIIGKLKKFFDEEDGL